MDLHKCLEELKFDQRLLDYNMRNNIISKDEVKKKASALKDLADLCEPVDIENDDDSSTY